MSLFDDQLADFREPHAPFTGRNSLTDHKRNFRRSLLTQGALKKFRQGCSCYFFGVEI